MTSLKGAKSFDIKSSHNCLFELSVVVGVEQRITWIKPTGDTPSRTPSLAHPFLLRPHHLSSPDKLGNAPCPTDGVVPAGRHRHSALDRVRGWSPVCRHGGRPSHGTTGCQKGQRAEFRVPEVKMDIQGANSKVLS
jgi:hypothetical protein